MVSVQTVSYFLCRARLYTEADCCRIENESLTFGGGGKVQVSTIILRFYSVRLCC